MRRRVKLSYIRKGDQLIIGVIGSYSDCVHIKNPGTPHTRGTRVKRSRMASYP
jgi:hypothetical protein